MTEDTDRFQKCIGAFEKKHNPEITTRGLARKIVDSVVAANNYRKSFNHEYEMLTGDAWDHGQMFRHMGYGILEVLTR